MKQVISGAEFVQRDERHTVFDSFFRIESLKALASPTFQVEPGTLGLHEDNTLKDLVVGSSDAVADPGRQETTTMSQRPHYGLDGARNGI
jgi:hypothetical protein